MQLRRLTWDIEPQNTNNHGNTYADTDAWIGDFIFEQGRQCLVAQHVLTIHLSEYADEAHDTHKAGYTGDKNYLNRHYPRDFQLKLNN